MRRKEREITDPAIIQEILDKARVLHLAMTDGDQPYLVAMNFGVEKNALYFHCALEGRKLDILRKNNKVAFFVDTDHQLITGDTDCDCTMKSMSVYGEGRACIVEDETERISGLDCIMRKYSSKTEFQYHPEVLKRTLVLRVAIERMTGKKI